MIVGEFEKLPYHLKMEAVLKATFLSDRSIQTHYIKLYALDNFYIEVFFDGDTHLITDFIASAGTGCLNPYLCQYRLAI